MVMALALASLGAVIFLVLTLTGSATPAQPPQRHPFGAGLSEVAGKVFRIGHLGDLNELMLLGAIAGAEMAMLDNGIKIQPGSGVAAAQAVYRANPLLKM